MGDGLKREETGGMKPIQEAIISELSLLFPLLTFVEDAWASPHHFRQGNGQHCLSVFFGDSEYSSKPCQFQNCRGSM